VSRHSLGDRINCPGLVDHATSISAMRSADVLLLVANTTAGAEATVPGKLFEYLAIGKPILAIAPAASSTADVLDQTGGGQVAPGDNAEAIRCALWRAFTERNAVPPERHAANTLAGFDRSVLAGGLADIFNQARAQA
jgi:glycosyltransferase involved in cell wall biosynthesis